MCKITDVAYRLGKKVVERTNWYNNTFWNGATKFWGNNQFGLNVVNLGSGAGYHAFNYEDCNIKARNWALGPQSLIHDYNILRNYFSYIRENGYVIITICPFTCLFSQYDKRHNFKYYTFLHPATIINFEDSERTKALKIKDNPFREMPLYCIKQTFKEIVDNIKIRIRPSRKNLQLSANSMMEGWKKQFGISNLATPLSEKHFQEQCSRRKTLDEMIAFCKERALRPVIVIPPMFHTLSSMFPDEFKKNYIIHFLQDVDALVLDYMESKEFDKEEYFSTALFLNQHGAKVFTKHVLKDIAIIAQV